MPARTVTATVQGHQYVIPALWLVGATHGGLTVADAIQVWHEQAQREIAFNLQRAA